MSEKRVKYDTLMEKGVAFNVPVAASQTIYKRSGKFVKLDSNERVDLADSGDGELFGWAMVGGDYSSSSTAGGSEMSVDIRTEVIHEIPYDDTTVTEAQLAAILGKTCDLIVTSGYQYADIGESNEDVIQIVGYNYNRKTVFVKMVTSKVAATGVV